MKVLTMGDPQRVNPLMYFLCRRCGCEFVANALECHEEQDQYNESIMTAFPPCFVALPCRGRLSAYIHVFRISVPSSSISKAASAYESLYKKSSIVQPTRSLLL